MTLNLAIKNATSFRMTVSILRDTQFNDTGRLPLTNLSKATLAKSITYKKMICLTEISLTKVLSTEPALRTIEFK
jgi:hypothetical protein